MSCLKWKVISFYKRSVSQMKVSLVCIIDNKKQKTKPRIFISCLTQSNFPLLERLCDRGWISCMFVNIICSPLRPRGLRRSLKVPDSNANICLATEPEWDRLGHLHQRYSPVDRSHKVEFERWNYGWAERALSMQIPPCTLPHVKQSILINISWDENLLIGQKLKLFHFSGRCFLVFSFFLLICHFLDAHLWKAETKHLVIMGQKHHQLLLSAWSLWWSEQSEAKCAAGPKALISTNNLARLLTLLPIH